jgi:hypothetical protein
VRLTGSCIAVGLVCLGFVGCGSTGGGLRVSSNETQPLRFVSVRGADDADGRVDDPWRTVRHAVRAAPHGAIITVSPGRYSGFTVSGKRRLTIRGASQGPRPVLVRDPRHDGDTVRIFDAKEVRLERMVVTGASGAFSAGVHVRRSHGVRLERLLVKRNESFGLQIADSTNVMVRRSVITRNDTGVQISRSRRVDIERNDIMFNDGMVVNDARPNNDRGANAVVVYSTPGPVQIVGNRAWGNRARSTDYGFDGGAFEIYDASRVAITGNRLWNNENVVETGTFPGGGCRNNSFERNVAYLGKATGPTMGMILRCAEGMRVFDNTFYNLDRFVFDITADANRFGGSVDGLTIVGNRAVSHRDKIYSIDSVLPANIRIDGQLSANVNNGPLAYVDGHGQTRSLAQFRAWTGFESTGRRLAPTFRDPAHGDFRRAPGSVWTSSNSP